MPPRALVRGDFLQDVPTREARDGDEADVKLGPKSALLQKRLQLRAALVVAALVPLHGVVVHLVDDNDEVLNSEGLGQKRVLSRLSAAFEARLELPFPRRDDEDADVCLGGALDHVRHVALVAGRIQNCESLVLGGEMRAPDLHRLALGALFVVGVHDEGQEPGLAILVFRLLLVLLHRPLVDVARQIQDVAAQRALARVDVANEHDVQVRHPRSFPNVALIFIATILFGLDLLLGGVRRRSIARCGSIQLGQLRLRLRFRLRQCTFLRRGFRLGLLCYVRLRSAVLPVLAGALRGSRRLSGLTVLLPVVDLCPAPFLEKLQDFGSTHQGVGVFQHLERLLPVAIGQLERHFP
mmetsp:Transcript_18712/g.70801  ORF Transcript_18712/g.70801 Transcript_18712/m.70801 type:complete len:353 (+) Transcript_18712:313-1371(+)